MKVTPLGNGLSLIDLETGGIGKFIASYVLVGDRAIIVETGPTSSIPNLLSALSELKVGVEDVAYVAVSHVHLDHGGGVGTLLKRLPNAKAVVHPRGVSHLVDPEKLWAQSRLVLGDDVADMYGKPEPVEADRILVGSDGLILDAGKGVNLRVVETLGHASHHLSFYAGSLKGVFSGDAAGIYVGDLDVVVPTVPPPFRLDLTLESLGKLIAFGPKSLFYSHFGRADDAVGRLRAYGEQLRLWARVAEEGVARGESVESIGTRIFAVDPDAGKALDYLRGHRVLRGTVLGESVEGVVRYVEKFGSAGSRDVP